MNKIKKLIAALVFTAMALAMLPTMTVGAAATDSGLEYEVRYNSYIEITGYSGSSPEVVIPAEIDGMPVLSIGSGAFEPEEVWYDWDDDDNEILYSDSVITSVDIPDGVMFIEDSAFEYCTNLKSVFIPDSVTSIEFEAFRYCTSLTRIDIPDNVTYIGEYAFGDCISLSGSIVIPNSVTYIGSRAFSGCTGIVNARIECAAHVDAFSGCTGLESVEFSDNVTYIGRFSGCTSLTDIDIPDGVTYIKDDAFRDCISLERINIPDSVTSIGNNAFFECINLSDVYYGGGVIDWAMIDGVNRFRYKEVYDEDLDDYYYKYISYIGLDNATIYYDEPYQPKPSKPQLNTPEITVDGDELIVRVKAENLDTVEPYVLVVATSDGSKNGYIHILDPGEDTVRVPSAGTKTVMVFCWDSIANMRPICEAVSVEI